MNPAGRDSWQPSQNSGTASGTQKSESTAQSAAARALGGYSIIPSGQSQQVASSAPPGSGPVLPPPSGPFFSSGQPGGHNLPSIAGLAQSSQSSPPQPVQRAASSGQDSLAQSGPAYTLSSLNQSFQPPPQHQSAQIPNTEQDTRDSRQMEDNGMREAQQRERELHERRQQEQAAHETHAGSIQLHQPIAVPPQVRTIHGPNGLLGNSGPMPGANALAPAIGVSAAPPPIYGNAPVPQSDATPRMQHAAQAQTQHLLAPFGAPGMAQGQLSLGQGQQPILNDALSYLDQVKVQFADHPDVYNRFLDIMKDFKSGAIDTPGVIDRVSSLFAGNPSLIQGFNTFLPPGYKIECGTADDPNSIRVTTPMGTTVSQLPSHRPISPRPPVNGNNAALSERQFYESGAGRQPPASTWQQPTTASSELFSPARAAAVPAGFSAPSAHPQPLSPEQAQREQQAAASNVASLAHQDQRAGVSQLQNAASVSAAMSQARPNILSPSGAAAAQMAGGAYNGIGALAPGASIEKRGPVEFNHAISYVNKIKNRFSSQPDIYKQFLEILQTYQRESKPIQDVYAQVTTLFSAAPDLLEDFKQFLPESAAQHRAAQAASQRLPTDQDIPVSNLRSDPGYAAQQTPRPEQHARLPPLGNFAPTPAKDTNKRKRGDRQGTATGSVMPSGPVPDVRESKERRDISQPGNFGKRPKQHHPVKEARVGDRRSVSPTLTPALPEALPPTSTVAATQEEMAFFERVKKYIANKNQMNEFLKLCNLYAQDIIEPGLFVARAMAFIGGNPELAQWLRNFMGLEPQDRIVDSKISTINSRVSLSNCRGLGPSYRLLPKRERLRRCSGRDDLCRSVLNDEWASHPTWASEDSGFVAHKKNSHEEGLHRIEEERHEYDLNIEACMRTVQQLEPIAQQLAQMSVDERPTFVLPKGLGGQSEAISKRTIMKVYGRETGKHVVENLFQEPYKVVPVLLGRLKHKLEEWKATQREWEKVWREQTQKIFWKSLDHQSASAKQTDKKQFQTKTLQNEIQVKYEEQKRQRDVQGVYTTDYQFQYSFDDTDVLYDASRLILAHARENGYEVGRTVAFIKEFVTLFFRLDVATFDQRMRTSGRASPENDDEETASHEDGGYSPRSQKVNGKKSNLLRGVLDRGLSSGRGRRGKEESIASGSRASTPEIVSGADEEVTGPESRNATPPPELDINNKWMHHPLEGNEKNLQPDDPYPHDTYNLYANIQLFCMFRLFVILYERLCNLKNNEQQVHETVRRAMAAKPAIDLKLIDKLPTDFFSDVSPSANYYEQILSMFEAQIRAEVDNMPHIEETLRRFYLKNGWQLYSFDKLLNALVRFAHGIRETDGPDKAWDIYNAFKKDRVKVETTHNEELAYRRLCDKCIKGGDTFKISFTPSEMKATVQIFKKEDLTFDPLGFNAEQRWRYYVASWTNYEPTEGVPIDSVNLPYLKSHIVDLETVDDPDSFMNVAKSDTSLEARIIVNNYLLDFAKPTDDNNPATEEWILRSTEQRTGGEDGLSDMKEQERQSNENTEAKLVKNNTWMKDIDLEGVQKIKATFEQTKSIPPKTEKESEEKGDVAMANAE